MPAMNDKDYYAILGVSKDATTDEIRKAFQQKARKLHPDVNKAPDAESRFKEASEAYAVLSDADKRRRYDALRSGSPFGYGDSSAPGAPSDSPFAGTDPFGWGFPFGGNYTRSKKHSRAYHPKDGSNVIFDLDLDVESAQKGCKRGITYQRYTTCSTCQGTGSVAHEHSRACPMCGGSGHISVDLSDLFGIGTAHMVCPECEGTGRVVADPCSACGGSGRVLSATELVIEVPANSHDGTVIRFEHKGNAGVHGGSSGDFLCRIGIPSERLSRQSIFGFHLLGFALPFLVIGLLFNALASLASFIVIPAAVGLGFVIRGNLFGHNVRWWLNGLRTIGRGMSSGFVFAVFMLVMISCMQGSNRMGLTRYF